MIEKIRQRIADPGARGGGASQELVAEEVGAAVDKGRMPANIRKPPKRIELRTGPMRPAERAA